MFIKRKKLLSWSLVMVISLLLWGGGIGYAKVSGRCDNCHTMHYSQGGAALTSPGAEAWTGAGEDGPYNNCLINDCVGCHSHADETTYQLGTSTVPVVYTTGSEPGSYLAGGNFYWVAEDGDNDDAKGHNVFGIADQDATITKTEGAPGDNNNLSCGDDSCHSTLALKTTTGYEASGGCEGCHLNVMHHADDGTGTKYVGTAAKGWYRFLAGHTGDAAQNFGVKGIEDSDWQDEPDSDNHNEYLGVPTDNSTFTSLDFSGGSMSAFCCGCHGNFHVQNANEATGPGSQSPWTRHPSDFVIPNTGEYAGISTTYDPLSPVARASLDSSSSVSSSVAAGTDMVMCLSCHRPHGSPYDDLLRWDYAEMKAGGGGNPDLENKGCFYCHVTKDD